MLTDLTIEGLLGVGRVELRFEPGHRVFTLFGTNGVGKTKCLEAIYQYLLLSNRIFLQEQKSSGVHTDVYVMKSAIDGLGSMFTQPSITKLGYSDVWPRGATLMLHDSPVVLLGARNRSSLGNFRASADFLGSFEGRRKKYFDGVHTLLTQKRLAEAGMSIDVQSWFVVRAHSVNPYQKAADNRRVEIEAVLEMLNVIDPRIDEKTLQVDGAGRVFLKIEGQLRALDELSSGFASLVKLIQAIVSGYASFSNELQLRQVRGIVIIDEIESHLHAQWQARIIPHLKTLLPNTTFYIATHSPLVLAQLHKGEAYLLKRDQDGVVRSSVIDSPDRRAFVDVLESAFDVNLNALKRQSLEHDDQTAAKQALLRLLDQSKGADA
jgi:predicted ATPase